MSERTPCPECGKMLLPQGMGPHRSKMHGVAPKSAVTHSSKPRRISSKIDEETLDSLIDGFLLLRVDDPVSDARALWKEAVKDHPTGCNLTPQIQQRITDRWNGFVESLTIEIPVVVEKMTPPPPFDIEKELQRIPLGTLMAVTGQKMGHVFEHFSNAKHMERIAAEPPVRPEVKERKIIVGIIGLLAEQQRFVEEAYDGDFQLRFLDKDKASKRIHGGYHWIITQRHVSHAWYDQAQKKVGSDRVVFVQGGISGVLDGLKDVTLRQEKLSART